jgi:hypothetical protein
MFVVKNCVVKKCSVIPSSRFNCCWDVSNATDNSHMRPQWPRRLRRRPAAERLLGSWVRIPRGGGGRGCLSCTVFVLSGRGWKIWVSNPGRSKRLFCCPKRLDLICGPPSLCFNGYRGLFHQWVKQAGREACHPSPSSAECHNAHNSIYILPPPPPPCHNGLYWHTFNLHSWYVQTKILPSYHHWVLLQLTRITTYLRFQTSVTFPSQCNNIHWTNVLFLVMLHCSAVSVIVHGPIPRIEESYRLCCVFDCDQVKINNLDTCCEQVGRRGEDCETKRFT